MTIRVIHSIGINSMIKTQRISSNLNLIIIFFRYCINRGDSPFKIYILVERLIVKNDLSV